MENNETSRDVLIFYSLQKISAPPMAIDSTTAKLAPPTYVEDFDRIYYGHITEDSAASAPQWRIEEIEHNEQ